MNFAGEAGLLRVFVGADDRFEGRPVHEVIVERAHAAGLAGATVLRGVVGYGAHSRIHTVKILRLSEGLPVVVEIVDAADRLEAFAATLEDCIAEGLVTLEPVRVLLHRGGGGTSGSKGG